MHEERLAVQRYDVVVRGREAGEALAQEIVDAVS
jgi:hypothetical protein